MKKEKWIFNRKWLTFYFNWGFDISFESCGYFDPRMRINFDIIFFSLCLILPFKSKHTDECDPPKWGVAIHNNKFWIYKGGKGNMNGGNKWWTWDFPWSYEWVRRSKLRKDETWEHEVEGDRKEFWRDEWKDVLWNGNFLYIYTLKSGEKQEVVANISVEEMEWRQKWLKWTKKFAKIRRSIDIQFSDEVGERSGSWKGGCLGCGYDMLPNEKPYETLKRMEKEREF